MMFQAIPIIAAADDNGPKIVAGLIVFTIWVIGALVTWVKKQEQEEQRRRGVWQHQRRQQVNRPPPPRMPQSARPQPPRAASPAVIISNALITRFPDVLRPPQPAPMRPTPTSLSPQQRRAQNAARARRPTAAPPLPTTPGQTRQAAQPSPPPILRPVSQAIAASASARPKVSASAPAIAKWLRPQSLRQQFILTEILQPPLALREEHLR